MLEDRPILQRTLIGAGAFAFVFGAAMAGSAFMISGGLGLGGDRADSRSDHYAAVRVADWAAPDAYAAPTSYSYAPPQGEVSPTAYIPPESAEDQSADEPAYVSTEPLDGEADHTQARNETSDEALARIQHALEIQYAEPDLYAGAHVAPEQVDDAPAQDAYDTPAPTEKTASY